MSTRAKFFFVDGNEVEFDCEDAVWTVAFPLFETRTWVTVQTVDVLTKVKIRSASINFIQAYDKP